MILLFATVYTDRVSSSLRKKNRLIERSPAEDLLDLASFAQVLLKARERSAVVLAAVFVVRVVRVGARMGSLVEEEVRKHDQGGVAVDVEERSI